jgi:hypothetical protein
VKKVTKVVFVYRLYDSIILERYFQAFSHGEVALFKSTYKYEKAAIGGVLFFMVRIETASIMEVDFRPFLLMREAGNSQLRRQQKTVATTNIFLFVLSYNNCT